MGETPKGRRRRTKPLQPYSPHDPDALVTYKDCERLGRYKARYLNKLYRQGLFVERVGNGRKHLFRRTDVIRWYLEDGKSINFKGNVKGVNRGSERDARDA